MDYATKLKITHERKEFDFVGYYDLILATLYTTRLYDEFTKFNTNKLADIFVTAMRQQVSTLPKDCELRKILALPVAGKKKFKLKDSYNKKFCLTMLTNLAKQNLIILSPNNQTISTFSKNKLTKEQENKISKVALKYSLEDNRLRNMVFDCTEKILSFENKAIINKKSNVPLDKEEVEIFFAQLQESNRILRKLNSPVKLSNYYYYDENQDDDYKVYYKNLEDLKYQNSKAESLN